MKEQAVNKKSNEQQTIYNSEFKERFLSKYQPKTQKNIKHLFAKAYEFEVEANKDLYNFTYSEFAALFESYRSSTFNSLNSIKSFMSSYVNFAADEGFVKTRFNFAAMFKGIELDTYIRKAVKENRYLKNIDALYEVEDECRNAQDAVIFGLLFDGVKNLEELQNIKIKDCDFNNNLVTLTRKNKPNRQIKVSDKTMELINEAATQEIYYKSNGKPTNAYAATAPLANTEYVLRPTGENKNDKMSEQAINKRVSQLLKDIGKSYLSIKNVWISGQIHEGKKIKKEIGRVLMQKEFEELNEKFGYDKRYWFTTKRRIMKYI